MYPQHRRTRTHTRLSPPGVSLPYTGGPGSKAFTVIGMVLTVSAVLGYAWRAGKLTLRRKA